MVPECIDATNYLTNAAGHDYIANVFVRQLIRQANYDNHIRHWLGNAPSTTDLDTVQSIAAELFVSVPSYQEIAIDLLEITAALDHAESNLLLAAVHLEQGKDSENSNDRGIALLIKAAELGSDRAQYDLGRIYYQGLYGLKSDYKKAFKWLEAAAQQDNANALVDLGSMFKDGHYVRPDLDKAEEMYLTSASLGNSYAYCELGYLFSDGNEVSNTDIQKAHFILQTGGGGWPSLLHVRGCLCLSSQSRGDGYRHSMV